MMRRTNRTKIQAFTTAVVLIASVIGAVVYLYLGGNFPKGFPVRNFYINVWFCGLLAFLALQALLIQSRDDGEVNSSQNNDGKEKTQVVLNNAYYIVLAILCLEMAASWDVYGRGDVAALAASCIAMSIFNVYVVSSKYAARKRAKMEAREEAHRRRRMRKIKDVVDPISERTALISTSESSEEDRLERDRIRRREEAKEMELSKRNERGNFIRLCWATCSTTNELTKILVFIVSCFLFNGAIMHGMGIQSFAPIDGAYVQLEESLSGDLVYYRCNKTAGSDATVLVLGNEDQGIADFLGIYQTLGEKSNVCLWDPPGIGFSGYAHPEHFLQRRSIFKEFVAKINVSSAINLVAFDEAAESALDFAAANEELVRNVLLIEPAKKGFLDENFASAANISEEASQLFLSALSEEKSNVLEFYNAFAVPLGLTKFMLGRKNVTLWKLSDDRREQRWYHVTERTWLQRLRQNRFRLSSHNHRDNEIKRDEKSIRGVPVHVLMSNLNEEQVEAKICSKRGKSDCSIKKKLNAASIKAKRGMAQNGGRIIECSKLECSDKDYFIYDDPAFTVSIIESLFSLSSQQ